MEERFDGLTSASHSTSRQRVFVAQRVKLLRKTHQAAIEALKRGVFVSVVDLQAAINRFVVEHNNTTPSRSHSLGPLIRQNHRAADAGTKC
jgi:hypothetical protein